MKIKPVVAVFSVYPVPEIKRWNNLRWIVFFLRDVRVLRKYEKGGDGTALAYCRTYSGNDGLLGEIVFPRWCGTGMIAHEACHAALATLGWMKLGWDEERFCSIVQTITHDIVHGGNKRKVAG